MKGLWAGSSEASLAAYRCGRSTIVPISSAMVGIENAAWGKLVVATGSGYYSDRGFTTNPDSIETYGRLLRSIEATAFVSSYGAMLVTEQITRQPRNRTRGCVP